MRPVTPQDFELLKVWADKYPDFFRRAAPTFAWGGDAMSPFLLSFIVEQDGIPVGLVSLQNLDLQHRSVDFGVISDRANPYAMNAAIKKVLAYAFKTLGIKRINAKCLAERPRIEGLLELLGFQFEGRLRSSIFYQGSFQDELIYSLIGE